MVDILGGLPGGKALEASVNRLTATARNGFEVLTQGGLETGAKPSPYTVIERSPMYRLRRYFADQAPAPDQDDRPVVLMVPPMMVDANVFDVTENNGAVSVLHRAGLDPWVIDFGAPDREEGGLERNLADHVVAISRAIDQVAAFRGRDVHIGGYSQGGMFCYQVAAYRQSRSIASLVTFGSPVDISAGLPLGAPPALVNKGAEFVADHVFNRFYLPSWMVQRGFELLNPVKAVRSRLDFVRQLHDRDALLPREDQRRFLEADGWVAYAGPAVADLLKQFVVHNRMLTGGFAIDGDAVSLASITSPVLAFVGLSDQIGRPSAVRGILQAAPKAKVYEAQVSAGHFGLVVGSSAGGVTYPTVSQWIRWLEGRGGQPENVAEMQPDDGRDVGVNPLVAGLGGIATVGFVAARDVLDAASGAAAGASAVAREVTRSLPKLARLGQLQAHTQVSLGKLLAEQAAGDPHGELFLYEDRVHTKEAVNQRIDRVVSGLIQVGVRQGEHVGVLMHTRPSALVAMAALSRLGAVAVLLPPGTDYAAALRLGEATAMITDPEHAEDAVAVAERVFVVGGGDRRGRPGAARQDLGAELVDLEQVDPDNVRMPRWYRPDAGLGRDLAFVMFSEVGGRLRAKRVTNGRWALSAFGTASAARLSQSDTVYCLTPLSHSSGLMTSLGGALAGGSRIALTRDFDPDTFMAEVQRYGVTVVCYTWNLMRAVLDTPGLEIPRYHPVRAFIGSGMSAELARRVGETFDAQVIEFYASTEGEIVLAKVRGGKPGAKGRRLPGSADVALVDYYVDSGRFVEDGDGYLQEVGQGEVGVLIGRADPDVTHRDVLLRGAFRPGDAWFSTGHLFRRDEDGDYWLVDDVRTVAVTDRGPVYSIPITDVLEQLGQVEQAVVYQVPADEPEGPPRVVAAVTVRGGATLTADDITDAFAGRHEQYPDAVHIVDEVPLTSWYRPRRAALAAAGMPEPGPSSWRFDAEEQRYH
ncbi:alpha/beta fold hydrolase [Tsukamurella pulmonis]|uniref:alpha/beta fold hydrolase n=1 Tax=Tsukamurella pulmonis TaxID=47312 RepID=UPI001EE021E0|nr:alpha/beta fold hydrolase [Tsukamurella pulmonis]